jgi:hypothetical protein
MSEETKGQQNRKRIQEDLEGKLAKYCPNNFNRVANLIAYDYHMNPDTLKYRYLPMYIDAGILQFDGDHNLVLTAKGQRVQATDDGLTKEQFKEELEEENEQRNKLGKPKVSLEEWRKTRSKRLKPVS